MKKMKLFSRQFIKKSKLMTGSMISLYLLRFVSSTSLLHQPDVPPHPDRDTEDEEVEETEAEGDARESGGPRLQPPGHSLGTPVPESVAL